MGLDLFLVFKYYIATVGAAVMTLGVTLAEIGFADGIGLDDVFWFCAGALGVAGLVRLLFNPFIQDMKEDREWRKEFRRSWDGEESRDGRDRVPGVMERLNSIDGELKRNGGSTVKDAVHQTKRIAEETAAEVKDIKHRLDIAGRERRLIIKAAEHNMKVTEAAFRAAGLEAPIFEDIDISLDVDSDGAFGANS